MSKTKALHLDAILWVVLIFLAGAAAFYMLKRDAQRQFGAVSFGSIPKFHTNTIDGKLFDDHMIKGHVWALHGGGLAMQELSKAKELCRLSESTVFGHRQMFVLSVMSPTDPLFKPFNPFHYQIRSTTPGLDLIQQDLNKGLVLLIDQNGIIRGKYDIHDPDGLRSFKSDLLRIL